MILQILRLASLKVFSLTRAKLMESTGQVPCICRYFSSCHIESPSNSSPRPAYFTEKNCSSILIFSVLPNRLGRVKVTSSSASHHFLIKSVLSI
jgi:hypothetical protein